MPAKPRMFAKFLGPEKDGRWTENEMAGHGVYIGRVYEVIDFASITRMSRRETTPTDMICLKLPDGRWWLPAKCFEEVEEPKQEKR